MLTELQVEMFLAEVGSNAPAPGGGSCAALAGALAASLVQMVAHLSGKEHAEVVPKAQIIAKQLGNLTNQDTEAFQEVMVAYKLPRRTDQEKKERRVAIQAGTKRATEVPLQVMEAALQALELAKEMALHGNPNTISDAGVAGLLGAAACRGAAYNVLINLPGLKDQEFVTETKARLDEILLAAQGLDEEIRKYVTGVLNQ